MNKLVLGLWILLIAQVVGIVFTVISIRDKVNNSKWDTRQTQYEQSGIPQEGRVEYIKDCFEK